MILKNFAKLVLMKIIAMTIQTSIYTFQDQTKHILKSQGFLINHEKLIACPFVLDYLNPAYGRHTVSQMMRIVELIHFEEATDQPTYQARESSLVPAGFQTAQFLQKLQIYEAFVVMGSLGQSFSAQLALRKEKCREVHPSPI